MCFYRLWLYIYIIVIAFAKFVPKYLWFISVICRTSLSSFLGLRLLLLGWIVKSMFHGIISPTSIHMLCKRKANFFKVSGLLSHFLLNTLQRRFSLPKAHSVTFLVLLNCSLSSVFVCLILHHHKFLIFTFSFGTLHPQDLNWPAISKTNWGTIVPAVYFSIN